MRYYWLILGILAVWRITHLFQAEDGPGDLLVRLRRCAGDGFWGNLLDCFYCLSLWIALPLAGWLGENWKERLLLWLAFSAGAILLERLTHPEPRPPPAQYLEDNEPDHVMLRKPTEPVTGNHHDGDALQSRGRSIHPPRQPPQVTIWFEYVGQTGMTVIGGATGEEISLRSSWLAGASGPPG